MKEQSKPFKKKHKQKENKTIIHMMNRITDPGETKSTKKVLGRVAMEKTPHKHGRCSFLTSLSLCRFLYIPPKFKFFKEEGREREREKE